MMARLAVFGAVGVLVSSPFTPPAAHARPLPLDVPRFEITVPAAIRPEPVTGRVYIMITRNGDREPRLHINQVDGIPFFGRDVERLAPGTAAVIDSSQIERVKEIAELIARRKPAGATTGWWKY